MRRETRVWRWLGCGCVAAFVGLTLSAGGAEAAAVPGRPALAFQTEPIGLANGFTLRVSGVGAVLFGGKPLTIELRRRVRGAIESHSWSFQLPLSSLSVDPGYGGLRIATGASL